MKENVTKLLYGINYNDGQTTHWKRVEFIRRFQDSRAFRLTNEEVETNLETLEEVLSEASNLSQRSWQDEILEERKEFEKGMTMILKQISEHKGKTIWIDINELNKIIVINEQNEEEVLERIFQHCEENGVMINLAESNLILDEKIKGKGKGTIKTLESGSVEEEISKLGENDGEGAEKDIKGTAKGSSSSSSKTKELQESRKQKQKEKNEEINFEGLNLLFGNTENMATANEIRRILERALGYAPNTLDAALAGGQSVTDQINTVNDRVNIVETEVTSRAPKFNGKDEEDVEEWIAEVEALFTASGRPSGANNVNIALFAIGGLGGNALRWYTERRTAGAGNLLNWADADNDNDLKHRIKRKFIGDEVMKRKLQELQYMKQKEGETVQEYAIRFK